MKTAMKFTNGQVSISINNPEGLEIDLWEYLMDSIDKRGSAMEVVIRNESMIIRRKK